MIFIGLIFILNCKSVILLNGTIEEPVITIKPPDIEFKLLNDLPPDIHRDFGINIKFFKVHHLNSALIIYLIETVNNTVLQQHVHFPGKLNELSKKYYGVYFNVTESIEKKNNQNIQFKILFNQTAQNHLLAIFYSEDYFKTLINQQGRLIYQSLIACIKNGLGDINFTINKQESNEIALFTGSTLNLNCTAKIEHPPYYTSVKIEGLDQFEILKFKRNDMLKGSEITMTVSMKNHDQYISCKTSGGSIVKRKINIYHKATHITIYPKSITTLDKPPINSTINCTSIGGYPQPTVKWTYLIGPHNATKYYSLSKNKQVLTMVKEPPPGSRWVFECSAKNLFPGQDDLTGPVINLEFNMPEMYLSQKKILIMLIPVIVLLLTIITCIAKALSMKMKSKPKAPLMRDLTYSKYPRSTIRNDDSWSIEFSETSSAFKIYINPDEIHPDNTNDFLSTSSNVNIQIDESKLNLYTLNQSSNKNNSENYEEYEPNNQEPNKHLNSNSDEPLLLKNSDFKSTKDLSVFDDDLILKEDTNLESKEENEIEENIKSFEGKDTSEKEIYHNKDIQVENLINLNSPDIEKEEIRSPDDKDLHVSKSEENLINLNSPDKAKEEIILSDDKDPQVTKSEKNLINLNSPDKEKEETNSSKDKDLKITKSEENLINLNSSNEDKE